MHADCILEKFWSESNNVMTGREQRCVCQFSQKMHLISIDRIRTLFYVCDACAFDRRRNKELIEGPPPDITEGNSLRGGWWNASRDWQVGMFCPILE